MEISSIEELVAYLKNNKRFFYDKFGVTRIGVFGSFARHNQATSSDIDIMRFVAEDKELEYEL
ncbi:MAG: nucleotidyltransferase domain-containing protein [Candidatus Tectomicrobia bacterium]|uniref:Nucleotidyltransferase domain-containing protein n=1 Tax=Tectimicrobiota bacterium TaxID=2528274 RepID=A0A933GM16_UNCTE|nr:nucleotidyltransferase domain-containing protein [Candidatus Tectomicrobia bacterium]